MELVVILIAHWVADFVLQSDWLARNKSHLSSALLLHVLIYSIFTSTVMCVLFYRSAMFWMIVYLWLIITHTAIDFATSRWTSFLYKKNERHWFFVVIGFDQLLHNLTLVTLVMYL